MRRWKIDRWSSLAVGAALFMPGGCTISPEVIQAVVRSVEYYVQASGPNGFGGLPFAGGGGGAGKQPTENATPEEME